MILLYLRDHFMRSLLHDYLEKQGFQVTIIDNFDVTLPPSTTLTLITEHHQTRLTDLPQVRLIWLVDCAGSFSLKSKLPDNVRGVLCSRSRIIELLLCLQIVDQGQKYVSSQLWQDDQDKETEVEQIDPLACLSKREKEVFGLFQSGLSVNQVATKLFLSSYTIETHRANIQRKLKLTGRYSLMRYAAHTAKINFI